MPVTIKTIKGARFQVYTTKYGLPFLVTSNCPKCGDKIQLDLSRAQHLTYPYVGVPTPVDFECIDCDTQWSETVTLGITLTATP